VWRGGIGRQARISALRDLKPERCITAFLETGTAKRIELAIGECGHADVVDVHVALVARDHRAVVITSDRDDILSVAPDLQERIVEVCSAGPWGCSPSTPMLRTGRDAACGDDLPDLGDRRGLLWRGGRCRAGLARVLAVAQSCGRSLAVTIARAGRAGVSQRRCAATKIHPIGVGLTYLPGVAHAPYRWDVVRPVLG
jgi:hypothetical protein